MNVDIINLMTKWDKLEWLIVRIVRIGFAAVFFSGAAAAQEVVDADIEGEIYREGFLDKLNVSTGIVVGLAVDDGTGFGSVREVFVDKSGLPSSNKFCLSVTSIDGLFWAENEFNAQGESAYWRVAPVSRVHQKTISDYGANGLIAVASLARQDESVNGDVSIPSVCGSNTEVLAPVVRDIAGNGAKLTVFVNSSGRFTEGELRPHNGDGEKVITATTCMPAEHDIAAVYDQKCVFDISEAPNGDIVELRLYFDAPPFGTEIWSELVALPVRDNG
jgi:hypothetical protein